MKKIVGVLAILMVVGFVFYQGSSEYLATGRRSNEIAKSINALIVNEIGHEESNVGNIELILRKLAHFMEYLMLGTVAFGVINKLIKNRLLALAIILLVTVPMPFIDEFIIQAGTQGRTANLFDVIIDLGGITLALVIGGFYEIIWLLTGTKKLP